MYMKHCFVNVHRNRQWTIQPAAAVAAVTADTVAVVTVLHGSMESARSMMVAVVQLVMAS